MRSILSRGEYWGEGGGELLESRGESFPYQHFGDAEVFYALKTFMKDQEEVSILILSDNQSVVSHMNKMGGTRSPDLIALTRRIWAWCLERKLQLSAQHIPGKLNLTADFLSRDSTDWILNLDIFAT